MNNTDLLLIHKDNIEFQLQEPEYMDHRNFGNPVKQRVRIRDERILVYLEGYTSKGSFISWTDSVDKEMGGLGALELSLKDTMKRYALAQIMTNAYGDLTWLSSFLLPTSYHYKPPLFPPYQL